MHVANHYFLRPKQAVIFLFFLIIFLPLVYAQNYSGLQGKILAPEKDMAALASQSFPEVLGMVRGVKVRSDEAQQLKVVLHYEGYEKAFLTAEVLDRNKRPIQSITKVKGDMTGLSSPLELTFKMKPKVSANTPASSRYLKLSFSSIPHRIGPNSPFIIFGLNKAWKKTTDNTPITSNQNHNNSNTDNQQNQTTNSIRSISPKPIGSAAQLRPDFFPRPQKSIEHQAVSQHLIVNGQTSGTDNSANTVDTRPFGPSLNRISLWQSIQSDVEFDFGDLSPINLNIFRDANPHSNHFYYLPVSYNLAWSEKEGYTLNQIYGTARDEGEAGDVRIHASLSPGIKNGEINQVQKLLNAWAKRNLGMEQTRLLPIPIAEPPRVSFHDELQSLYNISADQVSVNATSNITEPIRVSWATDSKTREEIVVALRENVGINGALLLRPRGDSLPTQNIPIQLNINDPQTFGRFHLPARKWRKQHWVNPTPYPVVLKYMHVMTLSEKNGGQPEVNIYSWDLGGQTIPPGGRVLFNADQVPAWLDFSDANQGMWLDYSVADCPGCDHAVISETLGGTSGELSRQITFESLSVLEQTGAVVLRVTVRSRQADPSGSIVRKLKTVDVKIDDTFTAGPLYIPPGQEADFEYNLGLVMPDGTIHQSDRWIRSTELTVYLGSKTVREVLPGLPAR